MTACPDCGIDEARLSAADAVAAVRSFPRRYRQALAGVEDAGAHARAVAEAAAFAVELEGCAASLAAALDGTKVATAAPGADPVTAIEAAAGAIVRRADAVPSTAWDRKADLDSGPATARAVVARAAHRGSHHLRAIARLTPSG